MHEVLAKAPVREFWCDLVKKDIQSSVLISPQDSVKKMTAVKEHGSAAHEVKPTITLTENCGPAQSTCFKKLEK